MDQDSVVVEIQNRINPYADRIKELENSISSKDDEIAILRLAVERLIQIKEELGKPTKEKNPKGNRSKGSKSKR